MSERLKHLLTMAYNAIEHGYYSAGYYWLCQALGQANRDGYARSKPHIMRALSMVRRIEAS